MGKEEEEQVCKKKVVIIGGGIIGVSIAYYLAKLGGDKCDITIVERCGIASQASGKAGGFMALDWNDSGPLSKLARHSFNLHKELSQEFGEEKLGYRRLRTLSVQATSTANGNQSDAVEWLDGGKVVSAETIGSPDTTAQVLPKVLTQAMVDVAVEKGAKIVIDCAQGVQLDDDDGKKVTGVLLLDDKVLEADVVVIAMGPWSSKAKEFFPDANLPDITGSRAHSIVIDAEADADAVFLYYRDEDGPREPEIYPRPDGTVYVAGEGDDEALPDDPRNVQFDQEACQRLKQMVGDISRRLNRGKVTQMQACYLPNSPDALPVIGPVPNYQGAYIATGHSCWGILNAPGTGMAVAELILGMPEYAEDLSHLNADRFDMK